MSHAETSPLEIHRGGFCIKAHVNGSKLQRLRVDTGCATALKWVTDQAPPDGGNRKVAIGLAELNIPQTQTTVNLAGRTLKAVPTEVHRTAIFEGEAGLLGNGLLSRFETVTIDARGQGLCLGRLRKSQKRRTSRGEIPDINATHTSAKADFETALNTGGRCRRFPRTGF